MSNKKKFKQGMCFGTFDKFHPGHQSYISQAKNLVENLFIIVARDKNVLKLKGKLPSENENTRLEKTRMSPGVSRAVLGRQKDRYYWLRKINPDVIFLGYDQKAEIDKIKKIYFGEIKRLKPYKPHIYKSSKILCSPVLLKKQEN